MKSMKIITAALLLCGSFQAAAEIKMLNSVAAEVNASVITFGDVERAVALMRLNPDNKSIPNTQLVAVAKRRLIERALMVDAAKSQELKVTPKEIDLEIQRRALVSQQTAEGLYAQAKKLGWGRESYRLEIAKDLLMERVAARVMEDVKVSDSKVRTYIEKAKKEGATLPAGSPYTVYQVKRIFMNINDNNSAHTVGERMRTVAEAVQNGSDFETLAKRYSQDAFAAKGGLQELEEGMEAEKVDAMLQIVPIGQISAPIQTGKSWQMFQLVSKRTENNPTKMQEYAIRRILLQQEQQKAQEQFMGSLQHGAVVQEY